MGVCEWALFNERACCEAAEFGRFETRYSTPSAFVVATSVERLAWVSFSISTLQEGYIQKPSLVLMGLPSFALKPETP